MKPAKGLRKFKLETKYPHLRSDGMTERHNGGTRALDDLAAAMDVAQVDPALSNHWSWWVSSPWSCPCELAMQVEPHCTTHGKPGDGRPLEDGDGEIIPA